MKKKLWKIVFFPTHTHTQRINVYKNSIDIICRQHIHRNTLTQQRDRAVELMHTIYINYIFANVSLYRLVTDKDIINVLVAFLFSYRSFVCDCNILSLDQHVQTVAFKIGKLNTHSYSQIHKQSSTRKKRAELAFLCKKKKPEVEWMSVEMNGRRLNKLKFND